MSAGASATIYSPAPVSHFVSGNQATARMEIEVNVEAHDSVFGDDPMLLTGRATEALRQRGRFAPRVC